MGVCKSHNNNLQNKEISENYFSIINKILIQKNVTNFNLTDNLKICLNEKNFDQVENENNPVQYFTYEENDEPKNFINWLDFIYQYLSYEHSHNRYWAMQMVDQLDNETFSSESKYLSEFFMEEFEIENEPKCIQIEKIKNKQKLNLEHSYLNVTQNLGGSFNINNNPEEDDDEASFKYKEFRTKVKRYTLNFKQHILNEDHPINIVVQIFEKIWVEYANNRIELLKQNYSDYNDKNNMKNIDKTVNELTRQLQRFVVHLQISLKLFYSRTINYSCFNEEKDELINLVTTLVFRTGKIYETVFELFKLSLMPDIENMTNRLISLKKIEPEELGIFKQFCLNRQSLDYQEEILLNKIIERKESENIKKKEKKDTNDIDTRISLSRASSVSSYFQDAENEIKEKNIDLMLKIVRENKKRCPKYGDREIEETKVNLNYKENINLIPVQESLKKENELIKNALLPINEEEDDDDDNFSIKKSESYKKIQFNNKNPIIKENIIYKNIKIINNNNPKEDDNNFNKTMIIRTTTLENDKNLTSANIEKIFNRVAFIRTDNVEYLSYPYETAIQLLKQIKKYKTPFEKMMIIASISGEITDCINDFWRDLSNYIKNDLLNLEIDQLMSIFIYIIIKSQIYDISVHCKIIKSFTTCITKASMIGYYYSTVEASVKYIQSIENVNELIKK